MRTDQRRNEDLPRLKSIGGLFVCAAELAYTGCFKKFDTILNPNNFANFCLNNTKF